MGLQTGFLVAFGQLIPEHQVQLLGGITTLRVKQLPMLYVGVSNVACILGYQSPFLLIQVRPARHSIPLTLTDRLARIVGLAALLQVERGQRHPRRSIRHGASALLIALADWRSSVSPCTSLRSFSAS